MMVKFDPADGLEGDELHAANNSADAATPTSALHIRCMETSSKAGFGAKYGPAASDM